MLPDGLQIGHYTISRKIGSGGMGEVYLAHDSHIARQVAIKVMRFDDTTAEGVEAGRQRFQQEARAISSLDHPHILPLFDYGEGSYDGDIMTYLVMPYHPAGSLATWLKQHQAGQEISLSAVDQSVRQAADALQYAHDRQVVHQDVKLSNFLVSESTVMPDFPHLLLADFGLAKIISGASTTSREHFAGTPLSMAPEQWGGNAFPATDQYALAVMAYRLLTGRYPFMGEPLNLMYMHLHNQPDPPSTFNSQITAKLDAVLLRALAKDPDERFPRVADFAKAFHEAIEEIGPDRIIAVPLPILIGEHAVVPHQAVMPDGPAMHPGAPAVMQPAPPIPPKPPVSPGNLEHPSPNPPQSQSPASSPGDADVGNSLHSSPTVASNPRTPPHPGPASPQAPVPGPAGPLPGHGGALVGGASLKNLLLGLLATLLVLGGILGIFLYRTGTPQTTLTPAQATAAHEARSGATLTPGSGTPGKGNHPGQTPTTGKGSNNPGGGGSSNGTPGSKGTPGTVGTPGGGNGNNPGPGPTTGPTNPPAPTPTPTPILHVDSVGMVVTPGLLNGCGKSFLVSYIATFNVSNNSAGGTVTFQYSTDSGATQHQASITFAAGETSKSFTMTRNIITTTVVSVLKVLVPDATGKVTTLSPNGVTSSSVTPLMLCL